MAKSDRHNSDIMPDSCKHHANTFGSCVCAIETCVILLSRAYSVSQPIEPISRIRGSLRSSETACSRQMRGSFFGLSQRRGWSGVGWGLGSLVRGFNLFDCLGVCQKLKKRTHRILVTSNCCFQVLFHVGDIFRLPCVHDDRSCYWCLFVAFVVRFCVFLN